MADNIERVGVEFVVEGVARFVGEVSRAEKAYDSAVGKFSQGGGRAASATGALAGAASAAGGPMIALATFVGNAAVKIGQTFVQAVGRAISSTAGLAKSALMLAGKFQEMEFSAIAIGRAMGITTEETRSAIAVLNDAGIRYDVAAKSVAQFTRNQIDLADARELASIAQATGILVDGDSTETMERLTRAIVTGSTETLNAMSLMVDRKAAEETFAASLGKTADALTKQEQMQARVNAIIEASIPIMGVYDAAMQSPTKQLRSLTGRIIPEFLAALGAPFQSAFFTVVKSVSNFVVALKGAISEGGALYPVMVRIGAAASLLADGFKSLVDKAVGFVTGFRTDFLGGLAETAKGALMWGFNIIAWLAKGLAQAITTTLVPVINAVAGFFADWFGASSPPKVASDIDKWGAATMTEYLKGFTEADFSVLNKVQGVLKRILTSGEYADISKDLIAAIGAGQFDEAIYDKIAKAAGRYGDEVAKLAKAQWELAQAEKDVQATEEALEEAREALEGSQTAVKGLTKEYNDLLRAGASDEVLKAKLAEINAAEDQRDVAVEAVKEAEAADRAAKERRDELAEQARLQGLLVDELLEMQEAQDASAEALKGIGKGLASVAKGLKGVEGLGDMLAMPDAVEMGDDITDTMTTAIDEAKLQLEEEFATIFAPLTEAWKQAEPALIQLETAFGGLMTTLTPVWEFIVEEVAPTIAEAWGIISSTGTEAWDMISSSLEDAKATIGGALEDLGIDFEGLGITWEDVKENFLGSIVSFAARTAAKIDFVARVVASFISGIASAIKLGVDIWTGFKEYWITVFEVLKEVTGTSLKNIFTTFSDTFERVIEAVGEKMDALRRKVLDKFAQMLEAVKGTIADWIEVGKAIVQGIIDGVSEMYEALKLKIRKMAEDILRWFKQMFGIDSPSSVAAEIGSAVVAGFIKGVEDMSKTAVPDIPVSLSPIGQALLATGGIAPTASQPVVSQSIIRSAEVSIGPVTIQSGMDEAELQYMVEEAVMRAMRR